MLDVATLRRDLNAISADVPASAVWRNMQSGSATSIVPLFDVSYNPGDETQDPVLGGIIPGQGGPTLVVDKAKFPGGVFPEENDLMEVTYGGQTFTLRVSSVQRGYVGLTIVLATPFRAPRASCRSHSRKIPSLRLRPKLLLTNNHGRSCSHSPRSLRAGLPARRGDRNDRVRLRLLGLGHARGRL